MATPLPRMCVIIPAYQAVETLPEVLRGVMAWGLPILVVDDGSSDGSAAMLAEWRDEHGGCHLLTMARNSGKAAALRAGFAEAMRLGFDHAVTLDADGQHDPADGPALIARYAEHNGDSLICGLRDRDTPGYPRRNLTGRALNDLAIRAQTGVRVSDCPCGFRIYPLKATRDVRCVSGRFAWEEEFITRAIWAGFGYAALPIRCIYRVNGKRTTHYRFKRDWPEGLMVNLWLLALAVLMVPEMSRRHGPLRAPGALSRVRASLSPRRLAALLRGDAPDRLHVIAAGVIGAALAALPASPWITAPIAGWIVMRLYGPLVAAALGFAAVRAALGAVSAGA